MTAIEIIDYVLPLVLIAAIIFLAIRCKFSLFAIITIAVLFTVYFVLQVVDLPKTAYFVFVLTIAVLFVSCISHIGSIRGVFNSNIKSTQSSKKNKMGKLVNREELYNKIYEAVAACSRQKIGALITFEKKVDLTNVMKNGTVINAPVTPELLMTIFYPGTRLHDGAVIIREDMIYAASVYYTPTTEALAGKYGSRHRAAIGISEISDSVTVVVSEETGRISIAQFGELESVTLDDFVTVLSEKIASNG